MAGAVSNTGSAPEAMLDHWRERGADRLDPVRFRWIEALHRRAAGQTGEARRLLDARVEQLMAAYAEHVAGAVSASSGDVDAVSPPAPAGSALAELLGYIASHARPVDSGAAANAADMPTPAYSAQTMLEDVRDTWSRVSAEKQLRQSLDTVPTNAGPLNSSSLVHRSLLLMRELSPAYLRQFLSYVDALSWLEQMGGGGSVANHDAPRSTGTRKTARSKAR